MDWKKLLAYITGSVDEELLLRVNTSQPKIPSCFSAKHLCGMQFGNTSSIITKNARIKEKRTACSFQRRR